MSCKHDVSATVVYEGLDKAVRRCSICECIIFTCRCSKFTIRQLYLKENIDLLIILGLKMAVINSRAINA